MKEISHGHWTLTLFKGHISVSWSSHKTMREIKQGKRYNIWCFYSSDYEEFRLLGYKTPVHTSQWTHYVSTPEPSLMLCKILLFRGGDYEECRLLGYKCSVRTSQEAHHVSAIDCICLMLCKIWGFRGSDCEEFHLLGYKNPVFTSQ
jgi:hypothetical protein